MATTDFFMPMVDDPFDFGRIAATNALSDVYAMGGRRSWRWPSSACRSTRCRPRPSGDPAGGEAVCAAAGIPIAGGHSIDSVEPIYGLVALGLVHPDRVKTNSGARAGDVLILGKALGVGCPERRVQAGRLAAGGLRAR